ncbi:hypothetical protein EUTSA_v10029064mg [Eutrema salsugineum]|uniref:Uncharacterized protein n=1 Tax=Eutrema salsugineum TaxID=72664 RepID=V4KL72_EUTSA|nr:uncharacterized protein LOC18014492 [Eutrema salsugineum]ESQ38650.1 hypothetical protein EUTSA_v10029064mg [Eutrema salsugineum]
MLTAASFLPTRWSRILFFLLCSPILLPLLCLSIPLLCAVEIFSRLRCRILKSTPSEVIAADEDDLGLRRCEEGCGGCGEFVVEEYEDGIEGSGLLQRYLEDQLSLARSIYDCGEDDGDRDPDPIRVPLLS